MICMRNVRIFRIKRGRFLKFSKTKENCLTSNKYIPKNYLFPPSISNSNLSSNIDESKIKKKKKEKNLEKTSPRIFLLEFTNEPLRLV